MTNYKPLLLEAVARGDYDKFNSAIRHTNKVYLILGSRGMGKSVIGFRILENLAYLKGKKAMALNFPSDELPDWIKKITDLSEIENESILIVDEGALSFDAKSHFSFENKQLKQLMVISRHKNIDLIMISQNSANIDLNVIRLADIIVLKQCSLMQVELERESIAKMFKEAEKHFEKVIYPKKFNFIISKEFKGFVRNALPSFWNESLSSAFKDFVFEKKETNIKIKVV